METNISHTAVVEIAQLQSNLIQVEFKRHWKFSWNSCVVLQKSFTSAPNSIHFVWCKRFATASTLLHWCYDA